MSPPFRVAQEKVVDSLGHHVKLYADVPEILAWCDSNEIPLALASRTQEPNWARELLHLLEMTSRFKQQEIYPSSKLRHFQAINERRGTAFGEMLFFDDEFRNIREVSGLGVTSIFVEQGMNMNLFKEGINRFTLRSS